MVLPNLRGKQCGGGGVPGASVPPCGLVLARFADDVKDSPSGSKGWCYRELARSCQLECAVGFLVIRSLLIAPGGGEEGLIFSGLCKSLSAPLCFSFCARGSSCDLCTQAQRDGAVGSSAPLATHRLVLGLPVWPKRAASPARGNSGSRALRRVLRVFVPCRCRLPVPVPGDAVPQHNLPAVR